ncbi:MAG TPA: hypothetical protein VK836_16505 [Streptosporangiaceae bacterium]|nr:hypothetical protein [Streptosporangiaceae bacterium]
MSASDAAPLPRLGEVFFDVRGNSRSMRLSWYADTGVAVFSIWQGGMCTGTFRLPIDDLARMIEILQRGPRGHREVDAAEHGGPSYAEPAAYDDYDAGYPGDHDGGAEHGAGEHGAGEHGASEYGRGAHRTDRHRRSDYGADEYGADEYGADEYGTSEHRTSEHRTSDYRAGDYGQPDYGAGYAGGDPGYADGPYRDPGHRAEGHRPPGHRGGGHRADGYGPDAYGAEGYRAADHGLPDYEQMQPDYEQMQGAPRPARWRDDERYQPDVTGQYSVAAEEAGYDQQRFVPPYVRPQPGSSQAGYLDDPDYRLPADPRAGTRHSAGRPSGGQE